MNTQIATTGRMEAPPGKGSSSLRVILGLGALLAGLCLWSSGAGLRRYQRIHHGTRHTGRRDADV